jgi:hypothetical protein
VVAGYVCAVAGAAISLSVIIGWQSWSNGFASTIPMPHRLFQFVIVMTAITFYLWIFTLVIAVIPFLAVYQIATRFNIRNMVYYLVCGAVVGLTLTPVYVSLPAPQPWDVDEPPFLVQCVSAAPSLVISGAIGALVFWWTAGRHLANRPN